MEKKKSQVDDYIVHKRKKYVLTFCLFVSLIVLFVVSMLVGQYEISPAECLQALFANITDNKRTEMIRNIMFNIRLPRSLAAMLIGGSLSIAGLTYQCVFRNMLVSQDVLGVSTGACVGAALAIILDLSTMYIQGFSFLSGIASVLLVFLLSKTFRFDKTLSLVLSGILISGLMSSVLGYITNAFAFPTRWQDVFFCFLIISHCT